MRSYALAVLLAAACVSGPKLPPVDEGPRDSSFVTFREHLLDAARRHDVKAVLAAVDSDVQANFEGERGMAAFLRQWTPDAPDTALFEELEHILMLGGTFDGPRFTAPYVTSRWPRESDPMRGYAVVGSDVPMYAAQDRKGSPVATLSYDIVTLLDDGHVRTADGREGWVDFRFLRSPIGYRADFVRRNGEWKLASLIVGN